MEETNQQPLALRVCAELAGSFLLCFAIYAFSTWGSAVYGINIVFFALATGLAYAAVTAIFSRVSGGQLNPAITVASGFQDENPGWHPLCDRSGHRCHRRRLRRGQAAAHIRAGSCQSVADSGR